ncbi:putative membrane protein [Melghiribacillus thermohalophilus]|uniref:Putative membrane protein n=1 Tax=Melghiribacillus thermohalophilus TaxID=1324956 RepID=A0A4R3NDA2_9BACI|nr:cytochrome c oxidase assembly factor CtaG [Melghiribacillus thermohalophilus]TCT26906.1 putative membrane protein [Melghiribacillus thermohalophilus]
MFLGKLEIFGFRALWSPYYLLFILALALLYYFVTGPYRHKFSKDAPAPDRSQQIFFYASMVLLYVIKGSPVDLMSHISLMAHMVQMAFYYLVFPIFVILGIPKWIWERVFRAKGINVFLNIFTKPLVAIFLFNGLFSIYHIPAVLDYSKGNEVAHAVISTVILIAAFCMWWPLFSPLKERQIQQSLYKIFYIFANGVLITPACGLIIFADTPLYATYSDVQAWVDALTLCVPVEVLQGLSLSGPELFTGIKILYDQQAGGIIMKILQEIIYGIILGYIFFNWYRKENRTIDPIPNQS